MKIASVVYEEYKDCVILHDEDEWDGKYTTYGEMWNGEGYIIELPTRLEATKAAMIENLKKLERPELKFHQYDFTDSVEYRGEYVCIDVGFSIDMDSMQEYRRARDYRVAATKVVYRARVTTCADITDPKDLGKMLREMEAVKEITCGLDFYSKYVVLEYK